MRKCLVIMAGAVALAGFCIRLSAADLPRPVEKSGPKKSGFYTFWNADQEFGLGLGTYQNQSCTPAQGGVYTGNLLLDCDAEVPHNETSIATNPNDPMHAVGAFHTYHLTSTGNIVHSTIQSTPSVTRDGGVTWHHLAPPITPYQFTGDPAVAFDLTGRIYLASIADHEGEGGFPYTGPSVVVQYSDDGGSVWTNPITVASGKGAVDKNSGGQLVFQDKDYIAVDQSSTSPRQNRAYVTWTSFQEFFSPKKFLARSPIMVSSSDDGRHWSKGVEISGSSPACGATRSVQLQPVLEPDRRAGRQDLRGVRELQYAGGESVPRRVVHGRRPDLGLALARGGRSSTSTSRRTALATTRSPVAPSASRHQATPRRTRATRRGTPCTWPGPTTAMERRRPRTPT